MSQEQQRRYVAAPGGPVEYNRRQISQLKDGSISLEDLAWLRKRELSGEIKKALASVSELSDAGLPAIPGEVDTPESWRRVLALHREISRQVGGGTYFLSSRDAAKAFPGLCHQTAYNINLILAQRGVIEIVRVGDARPNGKASQFRYLLSDSENGEGQIAA